jgi:hypothetical protein
MNLKVYLIVSSAAIIVLALAFAIAISYKGQAPERGEGYCTQPSDCKDLPHVLSVQCVGSWACVQNRCAWICETNAAGQGGSSGAGGGLGGSTVECVEDGNCPLGTCPDGYQYQKASCLNNACRDLNFFADPCMNHY